MKIALRKAQLVQEKMPCAETKSGSCKDFGKSFYFKINDKEVYIKGSNYVPLDYYPQRMKHKAELEWIMDAATTANFNLIRVWGGGMYEDDQFYEMADEKGILIW